jgi:hypothetical protein
VNPAAEGTVYPPLRFVVDPAGVASFRTVFGLADGVPPTFATVAEFLAFPQAIGDPALDLDLTRVLHGSQEYLHHRPMREGETLSATVRIESARVRAGNGFVTLVTEIVDEDGLPVCTAKASLVERGTT